MQTSTIVPQRPGLKTKWIYALGQLGWSLASFSIFNLLNYFYFPPEDAEQAIFPEFIYTGAILGILTSLGLINFGGRIFDGITDPMIASYSDRKQHRMGKRKFLMAMAIVPFVLFSILVFFPPSQNLSVNTIWLFATLFLFYLAMTAYVVPYTALISELGHHEDDRMSISTIISITWALGFMIGNFAYAIQDALSQSLGNLAAFQYCIVGFSLIGGLFMLIPVLWLDEKKCTQQAASSVNIWTSLSNVFKNINFRYFAVSDFFYWMSLTFIQSGISYFVTLLLGRPIADATFFLTVGFVCSFLFYWPLIVLAKRIGKKPILLAAFLIFGVIFLVTAQFGHLGQSNTFFYLLAISSAFPLAAFGIIPNAIIADIIYENGDELIDQSGMFYAARNFTMKGGIAIANLIFPSLLVFGKSLENPDGAIHAARLAAFFCILGFIFFLRYKPKQGQGAIE